MIRSPAIVGSAMLLACLAFPAAAAEAPPANPPAAPDTPAPAPQPVRTVTIEAYDVEGNTLLPQTRIEDAIYPFLGPDRTREDIESARRALETAYRDAGYQTVVVALPPQSVTAGIVRIK